MVVTRTELHASVNFVNFGARQQILFIDLNILQISDQNRRQSAPAAQPNPTDNSTAASP